MKTGLNKIIISFLIFTSFFSFQNVFAYDDNTTHPALTDEIVDFYNLSFPNKQLTSQQKEWVIQGSILEDTPPRWINHFYDPIYKEGWSGEHTGIYDKEAVQLVSKNIIAPYSIAPVSSLNWIHNEQLQAQYGFYKGAKTWERGILEMIKGNEKEAYMILGYILHLIEDATVPEHTRNDTHAHELEKATNDYGSPYEEYLKKYTRQTIEKLNIPNSLKTENKQPIIRQSIDEYLIFLAEYSNKYFFSKDTVNDPKYQFPKIIRDDDDFGYGKDENGKEFLLVKKIQNKDRFNTIDSFILDDKSDIIINAYFSRLSRQAVLNGAGVIDLFYKDIEFKKQYSPHLFTYDASVLNYFELPNISFTGEIARIKNATQTIFAKTVSTTKSIFSSVGNLLGINQSSQPQQSQQISLSSEATIPSVIENPIIETKTAEIKTEIKIAETKIETNNPTEIKNEILDNKVENKPLPIDNSLLQEKQQKEVDKVNSQILENIGINTDDEQINQISNQTNTIVFKYTGGSGSVSGSSGGNSGGSSSGGSNSNTQNNTQTSAEPLKILITEIQLASASSTHDDFIEIYNPNNVAVNLQDYRLVKRTKTGTSDTLIKSWASGDSIPANNYYLWANSDYSDVSVVPNSTTTQIISDNNGIAIRYGANDTGQIIDSVAWGEAENIFIEGAVFATNLADGQSIQRKIQDSVFIDIDNNTNDFEIQTCPSPKAQNVECQSAQVNQAPNALFIYSPTTPQINDLITFNAASSTDSDGTISVYQWDFGDNATSSITTAATAHVYSQAGNYSVSLIVFDEQNASSTATSTIITIEAAQSQSTGANHIVISEIQVRGDSVDDEFIELYNPTNSTISLSDYSIQYLTGTATSTAKIESNGDKRNFLNGAQIAAKSFYLLVNTSATSTIKDMADMTYSAFSLSGNLNGATIFLVSSSTYISNINDQIIIDSLSYGSPALVVSAATPTVPGINESLERKAFSTSTIDLMVSGEHKFSGNGYDADSADDFILRNLAEPQNSQNFPEPRTVPTTPQNFSIQYSSSTMSLNLNWSTSQDYSGATSTITYRITDIGNSSSTFSEINTTSTSASISINEVGRDYNFSIQAFDAEGLDSISSTALISVPNQAPLASFTFSPLSSEINQGIIFNAASSTDSDGQIVSYQWNFGDSATTSTISTITTHSYSTEGDYLIQLTIIDNNSASSIATSTISVSTQQISYQQTDYTNNVKNWDMNPVLHQRYIRQTLGNNLSGTISGVDYWIKFLGESYASDRDANFQLIECDDINYVVNCQAVVNKIFPYIRNVNFQVFIGENNFTFSTPYILNLNKFYYLQWDFPYVYQWWAWRGEIELGYSANDNYEAGYLWTYNPTYENAKPYDNNKDLYFILHFSE